MSFEEDIIISPANEYEVLQLLLAECRDRFSAYGGQYTIHLPSSSSRSLIVLQRAHPRHVLCVRTRSGLHRHSGMQLTELADAHITCTLADNMEADMKMLQQPDLSPAERTAAQAREQTCYLLSHAPTRAAQLG